MVAEVVRVGGYGPIANGQPSVVRDVDTPGRRCSSPGWSTICWMLRVSGMIIALALDGSPLAKPSEAPDLATLTRMLDTATPEQRFTWIRSLGRAGTGEIRVDDRKIPTSRHPAFPPLAGNEHGIAVLVFGDMLSTAPFVICRMAA